MTQPSLPEIDLTDVRVGHYVILNLGWMAHPFPRSSFLITTERELDTLRSLKLKRVCIDPTRSELPDTTAPQIDPVPDLPGQTPSAPPSANAERVQPLAAPSPADAHRLAQEQAERRFQEGARCFKAVTGLLDKHPEAAASQSQQFVNGLLAEMGGHGESAIRVLDPVMGDRQAQHAVNVMVLSLLLGKALGLSAADVEALGQAAFLHDMGKVKLPTQVRNLDEGLTTAQRKAYESHVAYGVEMGRSMKLSAPVLQTIAQHHEAADGSGFPTGCKADRLTRRAQVLALVNRYDGLCNPLNPTRALTPHEAVSRLFASYRDRFDANVLQAFIRMMGVYPPGSIVQLSDGRFALVHVVNASRPLKPTLLVHEPNLKGKLFPMLDMTEAPHLSVQRSVRADQLPRAVLDDLAPQSRYCYYFERAVHSAGGEGRSA